MADFWVWVTLGLLTLATLITRASLLLFGESVQLPTAVEKALRYARPAPQAHSIDCWSSLYEAQRAMCSMPPNCGRVNV